MTGVWMSDSSGFAVTPPRADADAPSRPATVSEPCTERRPTPEGELVIARDEGETARQPNAEEPPREPIEHDERAEPRIERYRER